MTRKEVLLLALGNEIMAARFYQKLADSSRNSEMRSVFERLARFEHMHEEKIKNIYLNEFPEMTVMNFKDREEFRGRTHFEDPADVLHYSMEVEENMQESYLKLADMYTGEEHEKTFKTLAAEEAYHEEVLRGELQKLQGIYVWFDMSELNGMMED
jgi:rubrerythrin